MLTRLARRLALFAVPTLFTLAAGCAAPEGEEEADDVLADLDSRGVPGPLPARSGVLGGPVTQADGAYVADVTAAGSGCPAGTWAAVVSPDGQTFTLLFSAYEVRVSPGQMFDTKQCVVNVGFRDPFGRPLSFVIGSIYTQGYGRLDTPGMRAARTSSYVFSANGKGVPGVHPSQHAELYGPYDNSYLQTDNVFAGTWSPCASVSNLVVNTNLMLQNNALRNGSGYLNASSVDASLTVAFRLAWRRC